MSRMDEQIKPPSVESLSAVQEADILDAKATLEASILHCRSVMSGMLTRFLAEADRRKPETDTYIVGIHFAMATMDATRCVLLSPHPAVFLYMMMRGFAERAVQLRWMSLASNGLNRFLAYWDEKNRDWWQKGEKFIGPTAAFDLAKTFPRAELAKGEKRMPDALPEVIEGIHQALRAKGKQIPPNSNQTEYRLTFGEWHSGAHAHHGIIRHFLLVDDGAEYMRGCSKTLFQLPCLWLAEAVCEYMGWDADHYAQHLREFKP